MKWLYKAALVSKVTWIALLPLLAGGAFKSCVEQLPANQAQSRPTGMSRRMDGVWRSIARTVFSEAQARHQSLERILGEEEKRLPQGAIEVLPPDESEMSVVGTYGELPDVQVDQGHGAIFPMPVAPPHRFSWYQVASGAQRLLRLTKRLEERVDQWKTLPDDLRVAQFNEIGGLWNQLNSEFVTVSRQVRYLEAWVPQLVANWDSELHEGRKPASFLLAESLVQGDPGSLGTLREMLRPRRVLSRPFLPDRPKGTVDLPIATDVTDRKFLAEIEGALATHWNQSAWARSQGMKFRIRWKFVPRNRYFATGRMTLEQHLKIFPPEMAAMTTGGLTTYVKGNALVLGPGKINPRTLAHELGHLMGFGDCYLRTISGQGFFGLAVLEWDNPIYPDDLMCDNSVGVPRAEVW